MKRLVAALGLLAAILPPSAAHAATLDIDVRSNFFSPAIAGPQAGDTVRWTVRSGAHDVVAYAGSMMFASDLMSPSSPPYTQTYSGGDIWYRCTPHSNVTANGVCTGMCATLSDRAAPPAVPLISHPTDGTTVPAGTVVFSGSSEPWTLVRLTEGSMTLGETMTASDGAWTIARPMAGGPHTVSARAFAADASSSADTTITFTVGGPPDTLAPAVTIQSGPVAGGAGGVVLFGEATDDIAVVRVRIRATDVSGALVREMLAECPECSAQQVTWSAFVPLPAGIAFLSVTAADAAGNVSDAAGPVYAVVVPEFDD